MPEHSLKQQKYFMDDPREAKRLDAKVNADEFIETYLAKYLTPSMNIADIGCGAGAIASALAKQFKDINVTGVDLSEERLSQARDKCVWLNNAKFVQGNIYGLPLKTESQDLMYIRFLLEYLKEPVIGIKEMYRACKKGGIAILQDLDGQLVSHYPETIKNFDKIIKGLTDTGFDPFIGRKLAHYGLQAGFEIEHIDMRPYHSILGKIDKKNDSLWDLKLEIALTQFEKILGSKILAQQFKDDFMEYLRDEKTVMYSNVVTVYLKKN